MASVYTAEDRQLGRLVALKRVRLSDDAARNRTLVELFHQEFRTLAQLAHPNVVQVHDFGSDAQGPYYTMELLQGEDLHAISPLPWRRACSLVRDVCSALALLHSRRMLHRDLSPKNIFRMRGGRAKLIDFGTMAQMGPSKIVVGTPPLVPPEAMLQQPLDARADLYSIGGTLYFALTGTHAYPARQWGQLRKMWRTPPAPPSAMVAGIPPELDQFVLSLLSLEPNARPTSAAEVLHRLSAIASLDRDELLAVSHSYLATPELVGRTAQLGHVRTRLAELHAGQGGALFIDGQAGSGRSRMLDVCVLEAKLAGMAVARAGAVDAGRGAYGTVGELVRQLWDLLQGSDDAAAALDNPALALLRRGVIDATTDAAQRPELQAALRALLIARARVQPVVLAIDDIELCDEPSRAALAAALAACGRERVLIAAAAGGRDAPADAAALALLKQQALKLQLAPFQPDETAALLTSVFGEVPNLQALAARIHDLAEGNPRGCMELAQHVVDRGLVRYEMGSWVLPPSLAEVELPRTLSLARKAKLEGLSADARELAQALALAHGSGLDLEAYAELTSHADSDRVRVALDELLFAQILRSENANYVFEAQIWLKELPASAGAELARSVHGRIGAALERRGRDRLEIARFLLRAGEPTRTIDVLLAELATTVTRWDRAPADYAPLLQAAADACVALDRPRRDRIVLLMELVRVGLNLANEDVHEHLAELFGHLREDSGLAEWERNPGSDEPLERLRQVFEAAQRRYDQASPRERGMQPLEAVPLLVRLSVDTCAIAAQTGDAALFDVIPPSFAPFHPLSPAILRVETQTMPACRAVVAGCYEQARHCYEESFATLNDAAYSGTDEETRVWGIRAIHYALGCIEAGFGREEALEHAEQLQKAPGWLVPAYSVLQIYHLQHGNMRQAERYRRQIELTLLQSPIKPPLAAGALHEHVLMFTLAEDPNGMRQIMPELEALGAAHPGMRPFLPFARATHARLCGNYDEALEWLAQAQAMCKPGEHPLWPWVRSGWLLSLCGLGRYAEARETGLVDHAIANRIGLLIMRDHIDVPLALAEAKLGDFASACARLDAALPRRANERIGGLALGWLNEARARIALWMDDMESFERHAELCAQQYKKSGREPALAAKYERLMQEARHRGLTPRSELADAMAMHTTASRSVHTAAIDAERMIAPALRACDSREQRVQRALELLARAAGALAGELFLVGPGGLELAASTCEGLSGAALVPALARLLDVSSANESDDQTVVTAALAVPGPVQSDSSPTNVWPLLLACARGGQTLVAGVAALHFSASAAVQLPLEVAAAAAAALIDAGDVQPHPLGKSATPSSAVRKSFDSQA